MKIALRIAPLFALVACSLSSAQFIRPPIIVRPPPVRMPLHVPHVPHQSSRAGNDDNTIWWVLGGMVGVGALGWGGYRLFRRVRQLSSRPAMIRIVALPPGEAPEHVRRAWIGLVLPVVTGQVNTDAISGYQAVSQQPAFTPAGYAVEGKVAVDMLASASPDAATWWRENAPGVLAANYHLVFPAEVCERLDDLGVQNAA